MKPNPRPLKDPNGNKLNSDNVDNFKRVDCIKYDGCLKIAAKWQQFHCNDCQAYECKPLEEKEAEKLLVILGQAFSVNR